jgi:hypothetical protein
MDIFLNKEELTRLTGREFKSRQIEALRVMGISFFINAIEEPIVARAVIEGTAQKTEKLKEKWRPSVLKNNEIFQAKPARIFHVRSVS